MYFIRVILFLVLYWTNIPELFCKPLSFLIIGKYNGPVNCKLKIHSSTSTTTIECDSTILSDTIFTCSGTINQTDPFGMIQFCINDTILSNWFFLDPGVQTVNLEVSGLQIQVISNSKSNIEKHQFKSFEDSLKLANDQNITYLDEPDYNSKVDSFLFNYARNNPDSHYAMYRLASFIPWNGSKEIYLNTFNLFSKKIKKSKIGQVAASEIKITNKLAIGRFFPRINLFTMQETKTSLSSYSRNNKYTLIDIWSSTCFPCLQQFKELNEIYSNYKSLNFEIIGISNDTRKYKNDLTNAILKNQLLWPQLWDMDNILNKDYHVMSVPRNFLLDEKGKIIHANINVLDLEKYLSRNLRY